MASCESTGRELSFEWSHHTISSADSKVRVALQNPIKYSGSEGVKTVTLSNFLLYNYKEENRTVQKRGKNHEIKQYMEFMSSEIFYNSILWLSIIFQYASNFLFSKYLSIFSIHVVKIMLSFSSIDRLCNNQNVMDLTAAA